MGYFYNRTLGVAVQEQIAFAVHHNGAAHFIGPIIVMGNASQRSLDTAQDNGHIGKSLAAALAVNNGCAVGSSASDIARRVGIIRANFSISRVTVDHGVHVACRDAPKQIGLAQRFEGFGTLPIGLRNDANPEALCFQHATYDGHAKAGMVHISVTCHQDDVATVPTQLGHLFTTHGQEWGRAKASRPELAITVQGFGFTREKRDVDEGVHGPR